MQRLVLLLFCWGLPMMSQAQVLLEEDFENGWPEGWLLFNEDGLVPDDPDLVGLADSAWSVRYITQAGVNSNGAFSVSWYVGDAGPSDDWMVLPAVTVSANTVLSWTGMAITSSGNYRDRYQVAISTGQPELSDFYDNPLLFDTECTGEDVQPTQRSVNLSDAGYTGETVYIAFRNFTEPYENGEPVGPDLCNGGNELYIDDIRIEANVTSVERVDAEQIDLKVLPNPAHESVLVEFRLPDSGEVELHLVDLFGRSLRVKDAGFLVSGDHQMAFSLDGLSAGTYYVQVRTETFVSVVPLLIQ